MAGTVNAFMILTKWRIACQQDGEDYFTSMTLDEIKENVAHLTPDERFELAAFLRHVEEREDPEYQRKLDEADARISKGHSVTLKELRQMIKAFDAGEL